MNQKPETLSTRGGPWLKLLGPIAVFLILCMAGFDQVTQAEEPLTFQTVEALIEKAKTENAEIFSPAHLRQALKFYNKALEDAEAGKSPLRVQNNLEKADAYIERAIATIERLRAAYPELESAYEACDDVSAADHSPELYERASGPLEKAIDKLEKEDTEAAQKPANEAVQLLRQAEYEVIKEAILGSTYGLLNTAIEAECPSNTPGMYEEGVEAIGKAEIFIAENRYDRDAANNMVRDIADILNHAIFVSEWISRYKEDPAGWEDLILQFEWYIDDISSTLHINPRFDRDMSLAVDAVLASIRSLQEDRNYLEQQLHQRDETVGQLEAKIADLRGQTGKYIAELELKRQQILERERFEMKIARVTSLFAPEEGTIIHATAGEEDQIVIRLTSMNFSSGSAELQPANFSVLTKVVQVIREFPGWVIEVHGHTDSKGTEKDNLVLSQERADAVKDYLLVNANLGIDDIVGMGYGESRPLATNDTVAGRKSNRRIEIIIKEKR